MSNYTKVTNFTAKDALSTGDANKLVKGSDMDTEFDAIETASATKTDNASATIVGGTVDGAIVGGTTPAAGTFTGLNIYDDDSGNVPQLVIEQDGTGDAAIKFLLSATNDWAMGIDNSDSDAFILSYGPTLESSVVLRVDTTGTVTIADADITGGSVVGITDLAVADGGTGSSTAGAARTALDVDQAGTDNSTDVTLAGTPNYITLAGQVITRGLIDLTTDVTGDLPVAEGGTASSTASGARTALGVAIGSDVQAYDADLNGLVAGTAVDTTSGTAHTFSSIPSWVKRITMSFDAVSSNGSSAFIVRIGDSGGIETTSYAGGISAMSSLDSVSVSAVTDGFYANADSAAAGLTYGTMVLTKLDGNTWVGSGNTYRFNTSNHRAFTSGISKTLSGTLDRVQLTTVNGTDTFDAGQINILYE